MRLIIAGGRDFKDYIFLESEVLKFTKGVPAEQLTIVSGKARGADSVGEELAKGYKLKLVEFPADWEKHGRGAGFVRNKQMAEYATHLLAFWDGKSKGTENMILTAHKMGLIVKVVSYE